MKSNTCCIFNLAPHYRAPIYELMDKELQCDFYFGDKVESPIKLMDFVKLKGFRKIIKNIYFSKRNFVWQKGAWKLIFKPYKYYIITGSPNILSNWVILIFSFFMSKQVYAWGHGMKGGGTKTWRMFERTFYDLCDKVLLYGNYSKKVMVNAGIAENKLIPIYNSLDYERQLAIRNKLRSSQVYKDYFKNDFPTVIYVGRIQKSKKIDAILRCMRSLKDRGMFCNFVIVGGNVDGEDMTSLVEDLDLKDSVWFYGACYEEKNIGELIYNAQVCISPGPVGLTAIHSLTYGTPVISNNNFEKQMPEFESIIPKVTGDFFEDDDIKDLEAKMAEWLYIDVDERLSIRNNAYQVIDERYNPLSQIKILKSLLL